MIKIVTLMHKINILIKLIADCYYWKMYLRIHGTRKFIRILKYLHHKYFCQDFSNAINTFDGHTSSCFPVFIIPIIITLQHNNAIVFLCIHMCNQRSASVTYCGGWQHHDEDDDDDRYFLFTSLYSSRYIQKSNKCLGIKSRIHSQLLEQFKV